MVARSPKGQLQNSSLGEQDKSLSELRASKAQPHRQVPQDRAHINLSQDKREVVKNDHDPQTKIGRTIKAGLKGHPARPIGRTKNVSIGVRDERLGGNEIQRQGLRGTKKILLMREPAMPRGHRLEARQTSGRTILQEGVHHKGTSFGKSAFRRVRFPI